ncbi:MAG: FecR domain-containing protein [Desulfobulbaceae bacterium]|nr:FecR domain-containing protein [Desulfobulbaceae bacterium]
MKRFLSVGGGCLLALLLINTPVLFGADLVQQLVETFKKHLVPGEPLLGPEMPVAEIYIDGEGSAIGRVELVQGDGFIVHPKGKTAFRAKREQRLFQGDTLITGQSGRIQATLDDKSNFALAENSKLLLSKVFYKAATNERNSELNLSDGKGRFKVVKAAAGSQYKITTPTAVAGIRGSDFALMVVPAEQQLSELTLGQRLGGLLGVRPAQALARLPTTVLVTGEDTTLDFTGLGGDTQLVGPFALAYASGGAATAGVGIGGATALGILDWVGPHLAAMQMPPHLQ